MIGSIPRFLHFIAKRLLWNWVAIGNMSIINLKKVTVSIVLTFIVIFLFTTTSCSSKKDELNKIIRQSLRNDNTVSEAEWQEISAYIIANREQYLSLMDNDEVSYIAVKLKIEEISAKLKTQFKGNSELVVFNPQKKEILDSEVKFFIENSGSMDGYVRGITDFEASLSDLMVQLQYKYGKENLNVNFINTQVYPSEVDEVDGFIESLEPGSKPYRVGNMRVSRLNEIFKIILSKTDKQTISILISDCIYSLGRGRDTESALQFQKSLTKGEFLEKSKEFDISTIILKMTSNFTGNYYNKDNESEYIKNKKRPYYLFFIGSKKQIEGIRKHIDLSKLKGLENSYYLESKAKEQTPFYTILSRYNKVGDFKQTNRRERTIYSIENVKFRDDEFQFSVAVDFSNVSAEESYLENSENYEVNGFTVVSIEKIDFSQLHSRDKQTAESNGATHIITLKTSTESSIQDIELILPNKIPQWVYETNTNDDKNILSQLDKTFGIRYLIEGVSEAYEIRNKKKNNYISMKFNLKK